MKRTAAIVAVIAAVLLLAGLVVRAQSEDGGAEADSLTYFVGPKSESDRPRAGDCFEVEALFQAPSRATRVSCTGKYALRVVEVTQSKPSFDDCDEKVFRRFGRVDEDFGTTLLVPSAELRADSTNDSYCIADRGE